jgi:hypothetical protein
MTDVDHIHAFSYENEQAVLSSQKCGCFYCQKIFDRDSITEWIGDGKTRTAICPHCGVDAILPDATVKLSDELLIRMYARWFG